MTTAVRPESGLDWAIETPDLIDGEGFVKGFGGVLYNIALAARFGFENMPRKLPLTEQALLANFRTWVEETPVLDLDDPKIADFGRIVYLYLRAAKTKPQVGHFIGNGFSGNNEDADRWAHAGH